MKSFSLLSAAALAIWFLATLASPITHSVLETHYLAALALGLALVALLWRGPWKLCKSASGRLVLLAFFAAGLVALNPWTSINVISVASQGAAWQWRAVLTAPIAFCAVTWLASKLFARKDLNKPGVTPAERIEAFLSSGTTRFNLLIVAMLFLPALMALSGRSVQVAFWPLAGVGTLIATLDAVLKFARTGLGATALLTCTFAATAAAAYSGLCNEAHLFGEVGQVREALAANRYDDAVQVYSQATRLGETLHSTSARVKLETAFAEHYERVQNYPAAELHWNTVATLLRVKPLEFAPLQRVSCAKGESLPVWRKLLFEGFPAVVNPELTPGIMRLGEIASDPRAKLLAALAAWETGRPEAERKTLLEAVQKVAPNEPTSANLLRRLNVKPVVEKLWLPPQLIVGREPTTVAWEGDIETLGEMRTLVYLTEGHWEMFLRAAGTPLHEEWPIVRIELNGQVLGPTVVNKAEEHDVPFTFDVRRADIFQVRIILVNHSSLDELEEGHRAHRGLKIGGLSFFSERK